MKKKKVHELVPLKGKIKLEIYDEEGRLKDFHIQENTFMDTGDAHVADQLDVSPDEAGMGWMAIGTSATAFTTGATTLGSQLDRNALSANYPDQLSGADDNDVVYKATWAAADGTGAITEAGVFNSSGAGTMLCGATFPVINKGAADKNLSALGVILNEKLFKFGENLDKIFKTIPSQAACAEGVTT